MLPASHFPEHLPITLAIIPDLITFASLPVELTTVMGSRISDAIQSMTASDPTVAEAYHHPQIVGLANEYYSYTATREEYALQHYEGASTLLGPNEGKVLQKELTTLTPAPTSTETQQAKTKFIAGGSKAFGPSYFIELRSGPTQTDTLPDFELEEVMPERLHFQEIRIPRFEWTERCDGKTCPADWEPERREIRIIDADSGAVIERESDLRLVAVLRRGSILPPVAHYVTRKWVGFWIFPGVGPFGNHYRFEVRKGENSIQICSASFTLDSLPTVRGILPASLPPDDCPARR